MMLAAYAGAQLHRMDAVKAPSLTMNLVGACLVLVSLIKNFNLPSAVVESAWALVALFGLIRIAITRR
jgi:hypothetical protein